MSCNDVKRRTQQQQNNDDADTAACTAGSHDAQRAAAWSNGVSCLCLVLSNPVWGRHSDSAGRRPVLLLSLVLQCLPALVFWMLQRQLHWHPRAYYAVHALSTGTVSYVSVVWAALADGLPHLDDRAPGYGLLMAGMLGGYALEDSRALGSLSLGLTLGACLLAFLVLPETLLLSRQPVSTHDDGDGDSDRDSDDDDNNDVHVHVDNSNNTAWYMYYRLLHMATQPLRNVSILNRTAKLRWLTAASFLSSMVFAADATLFVYYVQQTLHVTANDLATLGLCLGIAGVVVQTGLLQPLTAACGERRWLIVSFACGAAHNYLYGTARSMTTLYGAVVLSQFTKTNIPLVAAQLSRAVPAHEQGRAQSALGATNALASAAGPVAMEWVQQRQWSLGNGPGFMFQCAAGVYVLGAIFVSRLPKDDINEADTEETTTTTTTTIVLDDNDDDNNHQHDDSETQLFLHPRENSDGSLEEPLLVQRPVEVKEGSM